VGDLNRRRNTGELEGRDTRNVLRDEGSNTTLALTMRWPSRLKDIGPLVGLHTRKGLERRKEKKGRKV